VKFLALSFLVNLSLVISSLLTSSFAFAGGRIFTNVYVPTSESWDSDTQALQQLNGIDLEYAPHLGENNSFLFNGEFLNFTYSPEFEGGDTRVDFREGYYQFDYGGLQMRLGRQIIPWGKSDAVNPTNYLSGRDFRRFSADEEVKRTGADGVMTSYTFDHGNSPLNLTAVWNAHFVPSTILLPQGSIPDIAILESVNEVPVTAENSEGAAKLSYVTSDYDLSASYFDGWNRLPELESDGFSGGYLILVPRFERVRMAGGDFSVTANQYVFHGEASYTWLSARESKAVTTNSHVDAVLGVERPFGSKFRVQLQALGRYFPDYVSPLAATGSTNNETQANQIVAAANARLQGSQRETRVGGSFRLSYGDQDSNWVPEIFALFYPSTEEVFFRPKILWRVTTNIQAEAGFDHYVGPADSAFGFYKGFSSVFAEARYLF
jgi:hypothetical protein